MGDRSPIIYTERKKRRMAAKAKEAKAQLDSENSVDALDSLVSGDNNKALIDLSPFPDLLKHYSPYI